MSSPRNVNLGLCTLDYAFGQAWSFKSMSGIAAPAGQTDITKQVRIQTWKTGAYHLRCIPPLGMPTPPLYPLSAPFFLTCRESLNGRGNSWRPGVMLLRRNLLQSHSTCQPTIISVALCALNAPRYS